MGMCLPSLFCPEPNFKALNIRESHERPEAMEETAVMMVGLNKERILQALELVKYQNTESRDLTIVEDYSKPNVSLKVERIILSYIDYINFKVWRKEFEFIQIILTLNILK